MNRLSAVVFLGACLLAGCSDARQAPPSLAKVRGTVTLDGKPMVGGEVRFTASGQPPKALEIKDGNFAGDVHVGKNHVDVVWDKDGPPNPMDPKAPPIKVNAVSNAFSGPNSQLSADVDKGGNASLAFEVKSARK